MKTTRAEIDDIPTVPTIMTLVLVQAADTTSKIWKTSFPIVIYQVRSLAGKLLLKQELVHDLVNGFEIEKNGILSKLALLLTQPGFQRLLPNLQEIRVSFER